MPPSPPAPSVAPPQLSTTTALISFPARHVLLVTLNRPRSLNCLSASSHWELDRLWDWFERDRADLRVAVVTGAGRRAFCAGADLKEWEAAHVKVNSAGFAGLSRRHSLKPILGAVNGLAYGGGMEICVNLDMVIASRRSAHFALPEVRRGVVAFAGALPRLARIVGRQRAMEMAVTGRVVGVEEARRWGLVNEVVEDVDDEEEEGKGLSAVVRTAIEYAQVITESSPDAVFVSRQGVLMGCEGDVGVDEATRIHNDVWAPRLAAAENMSEGLRAFVQKRAPRWVDSKL